MGALRLVDPDVEDDWPYLVTDEETVLVARLKVLRAARRRAIRVAKHLETTPWNPFRDAVVQCGYAEGLFVSLIAKELGVTRASVIGRARVLGLVHSNPRHRRPTKGEG